MLRQRAVESLRRIYSVILQEVRLLRRDPVVYATFTLMPLIVMAFLKPAFRYAIQSRYGGSVNGAEQVVPGLAVTFSLFLVGNVGFAFFREYEWKTWDRVRASSASPAEVMIGKVVVPLAQSLVQLTILFGAGGILFHLHVRGSLIAIAILALVFGIALVSLGLALLALCRTLMQLNAVTNLGTMAVAGLGGAIAPSATLPSWAQTIAPITPSYWAMRGFRNVILGGEGLGAVSLPALILLLFSLGCWSIAAWRFRYSANSESSFA